MQTGTYAQTVTITDARYVAAKIAADLKRLQRLSGRGIPSDKDISDYQQEAVQLLYDGYLSVVTYGWRKGNSWVVAVQYDNTTSGGLSDDDPGGIILNQDIEGAVFGSYLIYSTKWARELPSDEAKLNYYKEKKLPFFRAEGEEPSGRWDAYDHNYRSNDIAVRRRKTAL